MPVFFACAPSLITCMVQIDALWLIEGFEVVQTQLKNVPRDCFNIQYIFWKKDASNKNSSGYYCDKNCWRWSWSWRFDWHQVLWGEPNPSLGFKFVIFSKTEPRLEPYWVL